MTLMASGVIQRQLWRPFHKTSSKIVFEGWTRRWHWRTTVVFSNEECSTFTAMSSQLIVIPRTYNVNVTLRCVRANIVGVEKQWELHNLCVCIYRLRYPASNAHAPYCMKLEFPTRIFEKSSNIKFYENPSSVSRVVICEQTDGQAWRS